MKRKVFLVNLYYHDDTPAPERRDVSKAIDKAVYKSKNILVFDVVTEETRSWLFSMNTPYIFTRYVYRFLVNRKGR